MATVQEMSVKELLGRIMRKTPLLNWPDDYEEVSEEITRRTYPHMRERQDRESHDMPETAAQPSAQVWVRQESCSECDGDGCLKCEPSAVRMEEEAEGGSAMGSHYRPSAAERHVRPKCELPVDGDCFALDDLVCPIHGEFRRASAAEPGAERQECKHCHLRIYLDKVSDPNNPKWRHHGSNYVECFQDLETWAEPLTVLAPASAREAQAAAAGKEIADELNKAQPQSAYDWNYFARVISRHFPAAPQHIVSSTYGDIPANLRAMIEPHEWDNKTASEQRDWTIEQLSTVVARLKLAAAPQVAGPSAPSCPKCGSEHLSDFYP